MHLKTKKGSYIFILVVVLSIVIFTPFIFQLSTSQFSQTRQISSFTKSTTGLGIKSETTDTLDQQAYIAFVSDRKGNNDIYIMNIDGTNQRALTNHPASDRYPTWSPDGNYIAFQSDRDGDDDIYILDLHENQVRRITNNNIPDRRPSWSPDGNWVAYESGYNPDIFIIHYEQNLQTQLTNSPAIDSYPTWSPDSRCVLFVSTQDNQVGITDNNLYVIAVDSLHISRITEMQGIYDNPALSQDGEFIAYVIRQPFKIYLMNLIDGIHEPLIADTPTVSVARIPPEQSPEWSPITNTELIFAWNKDGNLEIYSIDAVNRITKRLTNNDFDDFEPDFWTLSSLVTDRFDDSLCLLLTR